MACNLRLSSVINELLDYEQKHGDVDVVGYSVKFKQKAKDFQSREAF